MKVLVCAKNGTRERDNRINTLYNVHWICSLGINWEVNHAVTRDGALTQADAVITLLPALWELFQTLKDILGPVTHSVIILLIVSLLFSPHYMQSTRSHASVSVYELFDGIGACCVVSDDMRVGMRSAYLLTIQSLKHILRGKERWWRVLLIFAHNLFR